MIWPELLDTCGYWGSWGNPPEEVPLDNDLYDLYNNNNDNKGFALDHGSKAFDLG